MSFNPFDFIGRSLVSAEAKARSAGWDVRTNKTGNIREGSTLRVVKAEWGNNVVTFTVAGFFGLPEELRKNMESR